MGGGGENVTHLGVPICFTQRLAGMHVPRNLPICAILKLRSAILKFEVCAGQF